jgi:hypothetical protein
MTEPDPAKELTGALLPQDREWLGRHGWVPPAEPEPALLSTGRAAGKLGIHPDTLARWWAQGKVTPAGVNARGQQCWNVAELIRQRNAHAVAPKPGPRHRRPTSFELLWGFLVVDVIVVLGFIAVYWGFYDGGSAQQVARDRTQRSNQIEIDTKAGAPGSPGAQLACTTYAAVLASNDPNSRTPGADRDSYEYVMDQIRAAYAQLGCPKETP